ncbi:MAG: class I SAM-dependent methyltransferase [Chloroflexi bacterium]|nr:class I SAM-dependent methyltransferase [Chloroflexota bacterium]
MERDDPAYRGQEGYNRALLRVYDRVVIGRVGPYFWRCPPAPIVDNYRRNIRNGHLDVGPGTGWFVERSGLPDGARMTIMDPNPTVLEFAAAKLERLDIDAVEADVCKPLPMPGPYASAALNLVIHCLPGPQARKAGAVANVAAGLAPDGVLSDGPRRRRPSYLARAPGPPCVQPAGRVRQPRRQRDGAGRDARSLVPPGRHRDRWFGCHLRGARADQRGVGSDLTPHSWGELARRQGCLAGSGHGPLPS